MRCPIGWRVVLVTLALAVQDLVAQEPPAAERKSAVCPQSRMPVKVDGKLDDWRDVDAAKGIVIGESDHIQQSRHYRGPADACAVLYLKWDEKAIYAAAVVTDDVVRNTNSGPTNNQNGDGLLVCFTPKFPPEPSTEKVDYPYSYILTPGDFDKVLPQMQIVKGNEKTACELAVRKTKHGYQIEAALPLEYLPDLAPAVGKAIGFEACQYEGDRIGLPTVRTEILAWNSRQNRMDATECGKLTFTGAEGDNFTTTPGEVFAEALLKSPFKPAEGEGPRKIADSFETRGTPVALYFDRGERAKILAKAGKNDSPSARLLERMIAVCDSYLETWKPELYDFSALTPANARQVEKAVLRLSLAFALTEEPVYADLARRTMLRLAERQENWTRDLKGDGALLAGGTLACSLVVGYDWANNALTDEERRAILDAAAKAGSAIEAALAGGGIGEARSSLARCSLGVLGMALKKHSDKAEAWTRMGEDGARALAKSGWGKTADEMDEAIMGFLLFAEPLRRTAGRDLYLEIDLGEPVKRLMEMRRTKVPDGWAIDPSLVSLAGSARAAAPLKVASMLAKPDAQWFYETCFAAFPSSSNGADDAYALLWCDPQVKAAPPEWFNQKSQEQLAKQLENQVVAAAEKESAERAKARTAPKRKTVEEQLKEPVPFSATWLKTVDEKVLEDFQVAVKPALLHRHPRLYFTEEELPLLRARAATTHQKIWQAFLEGMENSLGRDYEPLKGLSKSSSPTGRGVGDRTAEYGFAYALTRDDAYAELVKRYMLGMCGEFPWEPNDTDLVHGHALAGLGIAYDCAYDYLMPEEKRLVRDTLIKQTAIMSEGFGYLLKGKSEEEKKRLTEDLTKIYADPRRGGTARKWRSPGSANNHSWIQKTGMAIASAAICDECPDAAKWLQQARWEYEKILRIHGPDGASCEGGGGYWSYGLQWMLRYFELLYHTTGENLYDYPWLHQTGRYLLYILTPDRAHVVNFGDNPTEVGRIGFIVYRLASEFHDGHVQWVGDTLTYNEQIKDRPGTPIWNLFWCDPTVKAQPPDDLPPYRYFDDLEMATLRSDWTEGATLVAFRCGPPMGYSVFRHGASGYGHAHPDQNHVGLYAGGEFLLSDPGYSRLKKTREHNTVLVDGCGQVGEGTHWFHRNLDEDQLGRIEEFFGAPGYVYIRGDAGPAYHYKKNDPNKVGDVQEPADLDLVKFLRHVLFIGGKYMVTFDEIATASDRKISWLLHSQSPFTVEGEREFTAQQGEMRLAVKVVEPDRIENKTEPMMVRVDVKWRPDGKVDYSETPSQRGYVLEVSPAAKTASVRFLAAYYPYKAGDVQSVPSIQKISGEGWIGLSLASATGTDRVVFNTMGGKIQASDIATDAARCFVRTDTDGNVTKFVLHGGGELAVGERVLFRSATPVTASFDGGKVALKCDEPAEVEVFAPRRPSVVFVNTKEREAPYNGDTNLLRLSIEKGATQVEIER